MTGEYDDRALCVKSQNLTYHRARNQLQAPLSTPMIGQNRELLPNTLIAASGYAMFIPKG
jgi:hypothetical protein